MPTSPLQAGRFFRSDEREILNRRFEENPFGKDRQPLQWKQFVEAMVDYKTWLFLLMGASIYVGERGSFASTTSILTIM